MPQPGQMPQMPQMDFVPMILRFGPMLLSHMVFADAPGAVLYLPFVAKLEQRDDKVLQLILKVTKFGRRAEEVWQPGYIGRTFFSFAFNFLFNKLLRRIVMGKVPKLGIFEGIKLQQEL